MDVFHLQILQKKIRTRVKCQKRNFFLRVLKGCLFDIFMIRVMIRTMTMAVCNKG